MGYIDVINHFWEEFRKEPLPSSAVALFFFIMFGCKEEDLDFIKLKKSDKG